MSGFWVEAARIVKSGGSVALWTHSSLYCRGYYQTTLRKHSANLIQIPQLPMPKMFKGLSLASKDAFSHMIFLKINFLLSTVIISYSQWDTGNHKVASAFPKTKFTRMEWDRDGVLTDGDIFFYGSEWRTVNELPESLGATSMVIRWREAYRNLMGTDSDCVAQIIKAVKQPGGIGGYRR
ncbi:uncharacterized protein N7483_011400 [Penicillium malachiteum]|uniref:uncharacterized protein n=1 Tax=Penicillium malachiteum TaxID=1324776 RepID=UPI002549489E|nr:uncharacterized protein N7483_011400 [Penicillium malachiteum]KAJ5714219.1 hypothetical protein N7483_011400 [Penicillium malachiteum]